MRRGQGRQLLVDARGRAGRPVLGDLRGPRRSATAPRAVPRSTRIGSARSGTTCSCSTRSTARARSSATSRTRTSTRARPSSASRWCCRTRGASSRPICSRRCSRRCSPCPASTTGRMRSTTSRSGSSGSTREPRRSWWPTGSSRRTRVGATSCGGCCVAWSRRRGSSACSARSSARWSRWSSRGSPTPTPSSVRTARSSRRCSPPRRTGSPRRCARAWCCSTTLGTARAAAWSPATTRSSCPTPSGSRSS